MIAAMMAMALGATMTVAELDTALKRAPEPVRRFVERRAGCDHWEGEEPYDAERAREIASAIRSLRCARIETDERAIRKRYAAQPAILDLLDQAPTYE